MINSLRGFWAGNNGPIMIVFAATLMLLSVVFLPAFPKLLVNVLPDDAFYYFQIARHIVAGDGSTFDGINMTNGYHPLWMLVLIPIFSIFSVGGVNDLAPIYASLSISVLLQFGIGILLIAIFSRYTKSNTIKIFGLLAWFLNPYAIYEGLNGLETSLSLFLLTLFILSLMRLRDGESKTKFMLSGFVGGLLILSRLDMIFYVAVGGLWMLVNSEDKIAFVKKQVILFVLPIMVLLLPWFVWNYAEFGMILTNASITSTIVNHALIYQDNGFGTIQTVRASVYTLYNSVRDIIKQTGAPEMSLMLLGFAGAFAYIEGRRNNFKLSLKSISLEWYLFTGLVLQLIANSGIRWTYRSWYFISANIFLVIVFVWLGEYLRKYYPLRKWAIMAICAIFVFSYSVSFVKELKDREIGESEMYASTLWMNDNLATGSVIGVFNAGVQGYFSRHTLINLDGLVNGSASRAMQDKKLWQYIKDSNIQYISDFPIYINYRYRQFFGVDEPMSNLSPIHNINLISHSRSQNGITIYSVNK